MGHNTLYTALLGFYKINIFRTDHNVHRPIISKALVNTYKPGAENFNQFILDHNAGYNVALSDKVSHKGIFRFIINLFRGTHLLDISLVHDHNRV